MRLDRCLIPRLGHLPAHQAWKELDNFILTRREEGVSDGTINLDLAAVRRAYTLGERKGYVSYRPYIEALPKGEPRDGYYAPEEFREMLTRCVDDEVLRNILTVAYITGWRMRSILRLE